MPSTPNLEIVFGAGSIGATGWINTVDLVEENLALHETKGDKVLDTAYTYSPGAPTTSESLIGSWNAAVKGWLIDTKANSYFPRAHSLKNLRQSLDGSLRRLRVDRVRIFYLHQREPSTPLLEQLQAIDTLYKEGKFEKFGVSNFLASEIDELIKLAEEHDLIKVSVYQGQYNGMSRKVEFDLLPTLHKYGIAFYAYSPTAGGFFQEKHVLESEAKGRFFGDGGLADYYRAWYHKPEYFSALKQFHDIIEQHGKDLRGMEIAVRWICYHSSLTKGRDAVIMGTSKQSHIKEGLDWINKGPLPDWAVDAVEELWNQVKDVAPEYHRG